MACRDQPRNDSFLAPRDEILNLAFPILLFTVAVAGSVLCYAPSQKVKFLVQMSARTLFLNILHGYFTYHMLFFFPEAKAWVQARSRGGRLGFGSQMVLLTLALTAFFFFYIERIEYFHPGIAQWISGAIAAITAHHAARQFLGFSSAYDQLSATRPIATGLTRWERTVFSIYIFAAAFLAFFVGGPLSAVKFSLLRLDQYLMIACTAFLCLNAWFFSKQRNKAVYLLRLFISPMKIIFPLCMYAGPCVHGVEYMFLFKKVRSSSSVSRQSRSDRIPMVLGLIAITALLLASPTEGIRSTLDPILPNKRTLLDLMGAASLSLRLVHFYLDRLLFRMKDPISRQLIAPLIGTAA